MSCHPTNFQLFTRTFWTKTTQTCGTGIARNLIPAHTTPSTSTSSPDSGDPNALSPWAIQYSPVAELAISLSEVASATSYLANIKSDGFSGSTPEETALHPTNLSHEVLCQKQIRRRTRSCSDSSRRLCQERLLQIQTPDSSIHGR